MHYKVEPKETILLGGGIGIAALFLSPFLPFIVPLALFSLSGILFGKRAFLFFIIVGSITVTSTLNETVRNIILMASGGILLFMYLKEYGLSFRAYQSIPKKLSGLIIFVFLVMLSSIPFSVAPKISISLVIRTAIFFVFVFMLYVQIIEKPDVKAVLASMIAISLIFAAYFFSELAKAGFDLITFAGETFIRASESQYFNSNGIAAFFMIVICLLLPLYFGQKDKTKKIGMVLLMGFLLFWLFMANSRGALLAFAAGIFQIMWIIKRKATIKTSIILLALLLFLFLGPLNEFLNAYLRVERLATGRDNLISVASEKILANPIIGSGAGGFKYEMYTYIPFSLGSLQEIYIYEHYNRIDYGHAHSFYLFMYTELGLLGFILSLIFPIVYMKLAYRALKIWKDRDPFYYYLSIGLTGAGLAMFIRGLFEWGGIMSYGVIFEDMPFYLLVILLAFVNRKTNSEPS